MDDMKRKLMIVGVCALVVLISVIYFSDGSGGKRNAETAPTLVTTQDGKVTLVAQPNNNGNFAIVADFPKSATNAAGQATNSNSK